jgi:hypothetical protein
MELHSEFLADSHKLLAMENKVTILMLINDGCFDIPE